MSEKLRNNRPRKIVCLGLILCLTLICAACGSVDGAEGEYLCVELSVDGSSFSPDYIFNTPPKLILNNGGKGRLSVKGESGIVHWKREGTSLNVSAVNRRLTGSLVDGIAELWLSDTGILATFIREDLLDGYKSNPANVLAERWRGNWYGWWEIRNSNGTLPDSWYDCCAVIDVLTDGSARMLIWDEQSTREQPIGIFQLKLETDRASVVGGRFWFQEIEENSLSLAHMDAPYPNCLVLDGAKHEAEGEKFEYRLFLRPWGCDWEDVRESGERIPYHYDLWALPLIEQGETMPPRIEDRS